MQHIFNLSHLLSIDKDTEFPNNFLSFFKRVKVTDSTSFDPIGNRLIFVKKKKNQEMLQYVTNAPEGSLN